MNRIIGLICCWAIIFNLSAQPAYNIDQYNVSRGKKANVYNREAKKLIKSNQFNKALLNAANALKIAEKKKDISNAQVYLRVYYEDAVYDNLDRIAKLKGQSATFKNDQTVSSRASVLNIYTIMDQYSKILERLDPKAFKAVKKKESSLNLEIKRYVSEIADAQASLDESIELAAAMHYDKARNLARGTDMEANKAAAKSYRWSTEYVPGYRDAKERYKEAKKLGTTRLGLSNFENDDKEFGNAGSSLVNKVLSSLIQHKNEFEFFEALDRDQMDRILDEQKLSLSGLMDESTTAELGNLVGVNVILAGEITKIGVDRQKLDPYFKEYKKEVVIREEKYTDDEGNEKTRKIKGDVTVTVKLNDKISNAVLSASYKIIEVSTGRVLAAGEIQGSDNWKYTWKSSYTGDARAIPWLINAKEAQYPNQDDMMENAVEIAAKKLYNKIAQYASEVSK